MTPTFETRPDLGFQMGTFMVYPQLTTGLEYNDNIYAVKNNKESDWIATVAPRIMAANTWSCHNLKLDAGINKGFYIDNSDENYLDAHVMAGSRLNIVKESYLEANGGFASYHEARGSSDALNTWDEPARYEQLNAAGLIHHGMGRFTLRAGGNVVGYMFDKVDLIDGGTQNLNTRDRIEYETHASVGFGWMPSVTPFVETRFNWRQYDKEEVQRDSDGYRIGAGTRIYMGGITTGEVYGGYMRQKYDNDEWREDISGAWYGCSLLWDATRLTSVKTGVTRSVKETTLNGASGISATDVDLNINHELLRNLSIGLGLSYIHDDYEGIDIKDKYYKASPRISYLWNRNLSAGLGYEFTKRDSSQNEVLREYAVNRLILSLTGSF